MRQLNGVYTQVFNQRHKKVGHLFQGRYRAILVDKDNYLLALCRYVALNPVRAGLIKRPERWRWVSYKATAGLERKPSFLTVDWILSQFDKNRKIAEEKYQAFVLEGIGKDSPWNELKGQIVLGSEAFVERVSDFFKRKENEKEIAKVQRYAVRPSLKDHFKAIEEMDEAIYAAYVHHGYTLNEIANHLGIHYATVSRAVNRVEQKNVKIKKIE